MNYYKHYRKTEMEYYEIKREIEKYFSNLLEKYVDQGTFFFNSHFQLGMRYEDGSGTDKNPKKAFDSFNIAIGSSIQENPFFQIKLGSMYQYGIGTAKNLEKALELYQKAADQGNSLAQFNSGRMYEKGIGTAKNLEKALELYQKALELYQKAADQGCPLHKKAANQQCARVKNAIDNLKKRSDQPLESKTINIAPIQQIGVKRPFFENKNEEHLIILPESQKVQSHLDNSSQNKVKSDKYKHNCKIMKHEFELLQQKQIEQGQQIIQLQELLQQQRQ